MLMVNVIDMTVILQEHVRLSSFAKRLHSPIQWSAEIFHKDDTVLTVNFQLCVMQTENANSTQKLA